MTSLKAGVLEDGTKLPGTSRIRKDGQPYKRTGPPPGYRITPQVYADRYKLMPLDALLQLLNGFDPHTGKRLKEKQTRQEIIEIARAAAPYIHPRLSAVSVTHTKRKWAIDPTKLSDEEIIQLEHMMAKAQVIFEDKPPDDDKTIDLKATPVEEPSK